MRNIRRLKVDGFRRSGFAAFILISAVLLITCGKSKKDEEEQKRKVPQAEYTKEEPGEWREIKPEHVPNIEIIKNASEDNIIVTVALKNIGGTHYIERIGVMDGDKRDVAGVSFTRNAQGYRAVMTVYPIPKEIPLTVYAKCNLHDLWTAPLLVK